MVTRENLTEFFWELDGNRRNLTRTLWELDRKSSPHPFKKIRNIPWEHVYAMQLAHPFKKKRKEKKQNKTPTSLGHVVGATQLALLTCFILNVLF
jgi:hypothetical protein